MQLKLIPYQLIFKYPFKIAHTTRETTNNVYLVIEKQGRFGIGEAVFPPYQKEDFSTMNNLLIKYRELILGLDKENLSAFLQNVFDENPDSMACLACLDMALTEFFFGENIPYSDLVSVKSSFVSSYTIGLCSPKLFERKIEENSDSEYFKLKIDQENYSWILEMYPKLTNKAVVLDANQGFTSFEEAVKCAKMASEIGAMYLEQVFDKKDFLRHKQLKDLQILPIIADESFQNIFGIGKIKNSFDGINVKLMKCGGLLQASKILYSCKENKLLSVFGCMSDSIIGIEHAQKLAVYTDWVDLDGHLLNANNPTREFLCRS